MADGIYTADGQWMSFAESSALIDEFATRASRGEIFHWLGTLPDPDPILRKMGIETSVFEDLMGDDQVITAVMGRKVGTLERDFAFRPGDSTELGKKVFEMLTADLENIDMFSLIAEMLDAPLYGMIPVELLWKVENGYYRLKGLKPRPSHWFKFNDRNEPRFMTLDGGTEGKEIPKAKFIFVRHFPTYSNPYGLRLLSRVFWAVTFKRGGRKFWATYAERFGMPWTIGKYPKGTSLADKREMLGNLTKMVQDAVAIIPSGGGVELIQSSGTSGSVHKELIEHMDAAISKVLQGQTLTSDVSKDGAAYSAGKVHAGTLEAYQGTDRKLISAAMEDIAWIYTKLNMPEGVFSPVFEFVEEDGESEETASQIATALYGQGVRFKKQYYTRKFDMEDDDFEIVEQQQAGQQGGMMFTDSPPQRRYTQNQQAVEELVDKAVAKDGFGSVRSVIGQAVEASKDYDDLMVHLAALLPDLNTEEFQEVLEQAAIAAESFGTSIADDENE